MSRWIRGVRGIPKNLRGAIATSFALLGSFITGIVVDAAAESYIRNQFDRFFVLVAGYVGITVVTLALWQVLKTIAHDDMAFKERILGVARESLDRCVSDAIEYHYTQRSKSYAVFYDPAMVIRALVHHLHLALATVTTDPEQPWEAPRFQVTFMTLMDDGEIGILAWANNENRRPPSLSDRDSNTSIYKTTVTAELYRSARPRMRIVEDSSDDAEGFFELYDGEFSRLQSIVVYPVQTQNNELLGTLVVYCDVPSFFRRHDRRFWDRVLEIYALRIALEKIRLSGALRVDA